MSFSTFDPLTLGGLPCELHQYMVVRILDGVTVRAYGLVSKFFYQCVCMQAAAYPYPALTLGDKDVTIEFKGEVCFKPFTLFLRQGDYFRLNPGHFFELKAVSEKEGKDDLPLLSEHAHETEDSSLQKSIIILDYTTNTLSEEELCTALQTGPAGALEPDLEMVKIVFIHPKASQIPSEIIAPLLVAALAAKDFALVSRLLAHPNLKDLDGSGLADAIEAAILADDIKAAKRLCELPKFKALLGNHLSKPLTAALKTNNQDMVSTFTTHENASRMTEISQPLAAAIAANNEEIIELFLSSSEIEELSEDGLVDPIIAAIEAGNAKVLEALLDLPKASNIPPFKFMMILTAAMKAKNASLAEKLLQHPQMKNLDNHFIPILTTAALQHNCPQIFQTLLKMFDPTKMAFGLMMPLTRAIQMKDHEATALLIQAIDFSAIPGSQLVKPLNAAVNTNNEAVIEMLLSTDNAKKLSSYELSEFLRTVLDTENYELIKKLILNSTVKQILGEETIESLAEAIKAQNLPLARTILLGLAEVDEVEQISVSDDE